MESGLVVAVNLYGSAVTIARFLYEARLISAGTIYLIDTVVAHPVTTKAISTRSANAPTRKIPLLIAAPLQTLFQPESLFSHSMPICLYSVPFISNMCKNFCQLF